MTAKLAKENGVFVLHISAPDSTIYGWAKIKLLDRQLKVIAEKEQELLPVNGSQQGLQSYTAKEIIPAETKFDKDGGNEMFVCASVDNSPNSYSKWIPVDLTEVVTAKQEESGEQKTPLYRNWLLWLMATTVIAMIGVLVFKGCNNKLADDADFSPPALDVPDTNQPSMLDTPLNATNAPPTATNAPSPASAVSATNPPSVTQATATQPVAKLGDGQNVVNNHGKINKIIINNHNYYGGGGKAGVSGVSDNTPAPKPWPYGVTPDKVEEILPGQCTLPRGTRIEVPKTLLAGQTYKFTAPAGQWDITPRFMCAPNEFEAAHNLGSPQTPEWKNWREISGRHYVSEYIFRTKVDANMVFILIVP